jgi:hypothetical protein
VPIVLSPTPATATWPPPRPTRPTRAAVAAPARAPEAVEVRTAYLDDHAPQQLLWRGRLWLVRHAARLDGRRQQAGRWRVQVADGPDGDVRFAELVQSSSGAWQLHEGGA